MALPSSGQLSIGDIRTEAGSTSGSLRTLSAAAGFSTPDSISEFYGWSSFNPRDYFDVLSAPANNTSLTLTGTNFSPQAGFHTAGFASYNGDFTVHVKDFGMAYDGQSNISGTSTHFTYLSNGITLLSNSNPYVNSDGAGSIQYVGLFGNLTQYTTGGITSLVNRDTGVGFFKTPALSSFISNWYHNLNAKPHFCFFQGDWGAITSYFDGTNLTTYAQTNYTTGSFQWAGLTGSSLFVNGMFQTVDSSKFVVNPQSDPFWDFISTEKNNIGFYAHPVADFSYTGIVDFNQADCQGGFTATVNIGARPKMVMAFPMQASNPPDFQNYIHFDGMPDGQSAHSNSGFIPNKVLPITLTSTGFTVGNREADNMSRACGQRIYKLMYYAII